MAKKHYIIEAKGKEIIQGNTITIEKCIYIEKNHQVLDKNGNYKKNSKKNISISDRISIVIYIIAIISLVVMIGCLALLRDGAFSESIHIDNIISEIGLIFAIISIKYVRNFLAYFFSGSSRLNKLMICISVIVISFYVATIFASLGISQSISNCISVIAILLSILSY